MRFKLVLFLSLFTTGCIIHKASKNGEKLFSAKGVESIDISSRNGDISLVRKDINSFRLSAQVKAVGYSVSEAKKRLSLIKIEVKVTGDKLYISPVIDGDWRPGDSISMQLESPLDCNSIVNTSNGDIDISHISKRVSLDTSNGDIYINRCGGSNLVGTSQYMVDANSSNGKITCTFPKNYDAPFHLRTSNGNIDTNISRSFSGSVLMKTSNGYVQAGRYKMSKQLTYQMGKNSHRGICNTSNGTIRLNH